MIYQAFIAEAEDILEQIPESDRLAVLSVLKAYAAEGRE